MAVRVGVGRGRLLLDGGCVPCAVAGGPQIAIDGAEDTKADQAGDIAPLVAAAPRWLVLLGIGQVPLVEGW